MEPSQIFPEISTPNMSDEIELEIRDKEDTIDSEHFHISHLECSDYSLFFHKFMLQNQPCIISRVTKDWPCTQLWVSGGDINYEYLTTRYGELSVQVSDCDDIESKTVEKTVEEYLQYLSGIDGRRDAGLCLYLKDWHLRRCRSKDSFYQVPKLFASDWLNEYSVDNDLDDFMFVYIGPKGSWTPLHVDVYSSFSWSVNVTGCKRWIMLPPGEEHNLMDARGRLPHRFEPKPGLRYLEVLQQPGDAIFVPSGWHHTVYNERDTISVNHNWINGCNILIVWRALRVALTEVEKELDDIKSERSFHEDCQKVLKYDYGINYEQFIDLLMYISRKRVNQSSGAQVSTVGGYRLGHNHLQFDLKALYKVISAILDDPLALHTALSHKHFQMTETKNEIAKNILSSMPI